MKTLCNVHSLPKTPFTNPFHYFKTKTLLKLCFHPYHIIGKYPPAHCVHAHRAFRPCITNCWKWSPAARRALMHGALVCTVVRR